VQLMAGRGSSASATKGLPDHIEFDADLRPSVAANYILMQADRNLVNGTSVSSYRRDTVFGAVRAQHWRELIVLLRQFEEFRSANGSADQVVPPPKVYAMNAGLDSGWRRASDVRIGADRKARSRGLAMATR